MIRKILLLTYLILPLFSEEIFYVDEQFQQVNTLDFQKNYEDSDKVFSIEDILNISPQKSIHLHATKESRSAFWTDITVVNLTDTSKNIIFRHPRAGLDKIDVYLFKDGLLISSFKMGDLRKQEERQLLYRNSMFLQQLEPHATYRMITRLESYGAYELYWSLEDPGFFAYEGSIQTIVWGLFGGILITLFIYSLSMFAQIKEMVFLVYALHVMSTLWHQFALNGIIYHYFHSINLNFITVSVWVTPYLSQIGVLLFLYYFFKLEGRKIGKWLLYFSALSFCVALFYLSSLWNMERLLLAKYITPPSLLILVFVILLSIYMVYKRMIGSVYFFLGQGTYIACSIYNISIISANADPKEYSWIVMPIGIVFDVIFLSLALGQKMHHIKKENEKNEQMISEQARFCSIGQTVGNITHQWKAPLSQLSSQFMFLQATFNHQQKSFLEEFKNTMPQITSSINYMQENIDMFHDFYKNSNQEVFFSPQKEISTILKILDTKIKLGKIDMNIYVDDAQLHGVKSAFSNIVMILLENSIEALLDKKDLRKIDISLSMEKNKNVLSISDNGGGINPSVLDKLFVTSITSKVNQGCGFGLCLAKNLAQKQLGGNITVENGKEGAIFRLIF